MVIGNTISGGPVKRPKAVYGLTVTTMMSSQPETFFVLTTLVQPPFHAHSIQFQDYIVAKFNLVQIL